MLIRVARTARHRKWNDGRGGAKDPDRNRRKCGRFRGEGSGTAATPARRWDVQSVFPQSLLALWLRVQPWTVLLSCGWSWKTTENQLEPVSVGSRRALGATDITKALGIGRAALELRQ